MLQLAAHKKYTDCVHSYIKNAKFNIFIKQAPQMQKDNLTIGHVFEIYTCRCVYNANVGSNKSHRMPTTSRFIVCLVLLREKSSTIFID